MTRKLTSLTKILFPYFFSFIFLSCNSNSETVNVKKFYFPFENFSTPTNYSYVNSYGTTDVWTMSYDENSREFKTIIKLKQRDEISVEKLDSIGADFNSYYTITDGEEFYSNILEKEVLNWKMKIGDKVIWKLENIYSDGVQYIQKERELVDGNSSVIFDGKSIEAIEFNDIYSFTKTDLRGRNTVEEFIQVTVYAKGIGIYSSERKFNDGSTYFTQLLKID